MLKATQSTSPFATRRSRCRARRIHTAALGIAIAAGSTGAAVNTVAVTANIPALGGPVQIGELSVDDAVAGGGGGDFIEADFNLDPKFAFLNDWYDFRWLNIETSINNDGTVVDPVVGQLPAVDPAPGDGIANGQPGDNPNPPPANMPAYPDAEFNDNKPWYYTDAEQAGQLPTRTFSDGRADPNLGGRVIAFTTYLCVESKTDKQIPATDACILAGFTWTSTIPAGGGAGSEDFGMAIPNPGAGDQATAQNAFNNSPTIEGNNFNAYNARTGCPLRACFTPTGADLDEDGDVDSDDLSIILSDFGCVGDDCPGDVDGLGNTNSDDLGILLSEFGNSYGACCFPDGTCVETTLEDECAANGGVWLGKATGCPLCPFLVPGACCLPNGDCIVIPGIECDQAQGDFSGPFTECAPGVCGPIACGDPASGDCCVSNGTPFCDNQPCCEIVCSNDPFCCNTEWDQICANAALLLPECECAAIRVGACCFGAECVDGLTQIDCDSQGGAFQGFETTCTPDLCVPTGGCGDPTAGDCCIANGTPFCNDAECCEQICAADPFCCETSWDGLCAVAAIAGCAVCGNNCPADLNGDGFVDDFDLQILLDNLGCTGPGCIGDLNGDGVVDFTDVNILKSQFGPCPGADPVLVTFEYNGKPQLIAQNSPEHPLPGFALTLSESAPAPIIVLVETISGNPAYAEPGFELPPGGSVALTRPEQASYIIVPPLIPGALAEIEVQNYALSASKPVKKACGQTTKDLTIEHTVAVTASAVTVDVSFTVPKTACELEVTIEVQEFDSEEEKWVLSDPSEQPTSPRTVAPGESQDMGATIAAGRRIRYSTRCPNNGPECSFTYTKQIVPN
ncbi:MAG: hypothetical protein ACTS3F_09695 [Phycisphaerales bacterium]